jgi:hypothetical protein
VAVIVLAPVPENLTEQLPVPDELSVMVQLVSAPVIATVPVGVFDFMPPDTLTVTVTFSFKAEGSGVSAVIVVVLVFVT